MVYRSMMEHEFSAEFNGKWRPTRELFSQEDRRMAVDQKWLPLAGFAIEL